MKQLDLMRRARFFATLKYARQMNRCDRNVKRLLLSAFQYAYTVGYLDREEVKP
jgi:hypothetical protein